MRAQQLGALVAHRVRIEDGRRLHRDGRHHLREMILDHVAQRAGFLVVGAASLDADRLRGRDLHVVHVAPVPQRLEDAVAEAEGEDVLHRFLAQVVIDAVYVHLREHRVKALIQGDRAAEVVPERLLDHDAPPALPLVQFRRSEPADRHVVVAGLRRQVEQTLPWVRRASSISASFLRQVDIAFRVVQVAGEVVHALREVLP